MEYLQYLMHVSLSLGIGQQSKKIVIENRGITIREVTEKVAISVSSCHENFSDV